MTLSKRTYLIIVALLTLCLCGCGVIVTPDAPPTPTSFVMQSLFAGDTCAPPCWFGLTSGVSTSADVEIFYQTYPMLSVPFRANPESELDPITGYVINGHYFFDFGPFEIPPSTGNLSFIRVRQSIVDAIVINSLKQVNTSETFEAFGQPDQIQMSNEFTRFC